MATTRVIPDDGNWATVMAATAAGDTIEVRDGTYNEHSIAKAVANVTIRRHASAAGPELDAGVAGASALKFYTGWDISGIQFTGGTGQTLTGNGGNRQATISNCFVLGSGTDGIGGLATGSVVDRTAVLFAGANGIASTQDGTIVVNCISLFAGATGIVVQGAASKVIYCTVGGSTASGITVANGLARGCICESNGANGIYSSGAGQAQDCVSHASGVADFVGTTVNCSTLDPEFTAPPMSLDIGATSPARGLVTADLGYAYDINLNPRPTPATGAYDAGAYQYIAADCGVDTVTQVDRQHLDVAMVASGGGGQIPDPAAVVDTSLWGISTVPVDATLCVLTAEVDASDDYLLHIATNHPITPGATATVDTSGIGTDAGGLCDDPGTGDVVIVVDDGEDSAHRYVYPISIGPLSDDGESQ